MSQQRASSFGDLLASATRVQLSIKLYNGDWHVQVVLDANSDEQGTGIIYLLTFDLTAIISRLSRV